MLFFRKKIILFIEQNVNDVNASVERAEAFTSFLRFHVSKYNEFVLNTVYQLNTPHIFRLRKTQFILYPLTISFVYRNWQIF